MRPAALPLNASACLGAARRCQTAGQLEAGASFQVPQIPLMPVLKGCPRSTTAGCRSPRFPCAHLPHDSQGRSPCAHLPLDSLSRSPVLICHLTHKADPPVLICHMTHKADPPVLICHMTHKAGLPQPRAWRHVSVTLQVYPDPPRVLSDLQGRFAAMILYNHFLAILPALEVREQHMWHLCVCACVSVCVCHVRACCNHALIRCCHDCQLCSPTGRGRVHPVKAWGALSFWPITKDLTLPSRPLASAAPAKHCTPPSPVPRFGMGVAVAAPTPPPP